MCLRGDLAPLSTLEEVGVDFDIVEDNIDLEDHLELDALDFRNCLVAWVAVVEVVVDKDSSSPHVDRVVEGEGAAYIVVVDLVAVAVVADDDVVASVEKDLEAAGEADNVTIVEGEVVLLLLLLQGVEPLPHVSLHFGTYDVVGVPWVDLQDILDRVAWVTGSFFDLSHQTDYLKASEASECLGCQRQVTWT